MKKIAGLMLLVAIMVSCGKREIPVLKIGHVGHDHHTALYLACLEGERFKNDHGIYLKEVKPKELYELYEGNKKITEIELYIAGGGAKMPTMMSQGHFEVGFGGVAAVAFFVDKGAPIKIIAPLHSKGDMLVVAPSLGANNWQEFANWIRKHPRQVRIGYKDPVAVAKLILEDALRQEAISYTEDKSDAKTEVLLVHMKGEENLIPGLQNKIIDAYVSNNPWCAIAELKGIGKSIAALDDLPPGHWKDHPCCCVAATDSAIARKQKVITKFLELIILATKYINEQPELGYAAASKWIGTSLDVERKSMCTSGYATEASEAWENAMYHWIAEMDKLGQVKEKLKGKSDDETARLLFNFTPLKQAYKELTKK